MKKNMHVNSLEAYRDGVEHLSRRARKIYDLMDGRPPMTDREIMESLGFSEPNAVRPRITEMIQQGLFEESGNTRCPATGKTVRKVSRKKITAQMEMGI